METKVTTQKIQRELQAASRKVFFRRDEDAPYPVYANAIEFIGMGMDLFMDVGVVSPESIQTAVETTQKLNQDPEGLPPVVSVGVLHRFAFTLQTATQMHQRLTELIEATKQLEAAKYAPPADREPAKLQEKEEG